ncbi:MAG: T9SS type A sorting domain-containing protein [Ignavibacterium sp.]|nr:MAG: T9SS type A sorting domain-containing protein [Ignavibacterium sp.]
MKNIYLLFFVLLFSQLTILAQWEQMMDMPTARYFLSSCTLDGKIYTMGGTQSTSAVGIIQVYDPILNNWDNTKEDMPESRVELGACTVNGKIYVFGGAPYHGGSPIQSVVEYDPSTDTWTTKAPMETPRYGCAYGVIDGKIYVAGGTIDNNWTFTKILEIYDPLTDSWDVTKAAMPEPPIYQQQGAVINDKFYVIGGLIGAPWTGQKIVHMYDLITDTWSTVDSLNEGRVGHTANVVNGKIYVIGGDTQPPPLNSVEEFDPSLDTWRIIDQAPFIKICHTSSMYDNRIYLFGGSTTTIFPNATPTSAVYSFDPDSVTTDVSQENNIPEYFILHQNYPNPFNPITVINYQIPELSFVTVKVYDVLGSEVTTLVNEEKPFGIYEVEFDARGLTSGIYFYTIVAADFVDTMKMVLMK